MALKTHFQRPTPVFSIKLLEQYDQILAKSTGRLHNKKVVFVLIQISLIYIDNFNDKNLYKSEKSEATQIQLADLTNI